MKIDIKNPIISSLFSVIITFSISMIVLYLTKPSYIVHVSDEGKKKKNIYLLFTYSMLFSVLAGITVLLWRTGESSTKTTSESAVLAFSSKSYRPKLYSPN